MPKSIKTRPTDKPEKPDESFPRFAHNSGRWAKKIRGKLHYFAYWREDRKGNEALERFNRERPYLKDGRTPPHRRTPEAAARCGRSAMRSSTASSTPYWRASCPRGRFTNTRRSPIRWGNSSGK